ncbi:MAG: hypothetical protein RLZZ338_3838 [Cyanobacteriota bacterium]
MMSRQMLMYFTDYISWGGKPGYPMSYQFSAVISGQSVAFSREIWYNYSSIFMGKRTVKVEPDPSSLSTSISPPIMWQK